MTFIQEALGDQANAVLGQTAQGPSALGDFWNLVEQAGPLRWPIFAVLGIGLALVIAKLYELLKDRSLSRALFQVDLRSLRLSEIADRLSRQRESMLAALQSTMLNVFQTRPSDGMLHDEITNFVAFQQDQFGAFRRRMEFLADTAGALGLMGTVWGMFQVFFQGTSEKDVILRGMGIALITTLLGLVVSIILNLSTTELSTFFGKRLEQVSRKSDELRFRLLELAAVPGGGPPPTPSPAVERSTAPTAAPATPAAPAPALLYVEPEPRDYVARAGETIRDLRLDVRRSGNDLAAGVTIAVSVPPGAGALGNGDRTIRRETDDAGTVRFDWTAPERTGTFALDASAPGHAGSGCRLHLRVEPGPPERTEQEGNNQAAVAGMRLPNRLGVCVRDRFDNPVPGVPVAFSVRSGSGRFGGHDGSVTLTTGTDGAARTPFAVSSEAGPNVVVASIEGYPDPLEFVAFGTEV